MRLRLVGLGIVLLCPIALLAPASAAPAHSAYTLYLYTVRIDGSADHTDGSGFVRDTWTATIGGVGIHPFAGGGHHSAVYRHGTGTAAMTYAVDLPGVEQFGEPARCRGTVSYRMPADISGGYAKNWSTKFVLRTSGESNTSSSFDVSDAAGGNVGDKIRSTTGCEAKTWGRLTLTAPAGRGLEAQVGAPWDLRFVRPDWRAGLFPIDELYSGRSFKLDTGSAGPKLFGWKMRLRMTFTRTG